MNASKQRPMELSAELFAAHSECERATARLRAAFEAVARYPDLTPAQRKRARWVAEQVESLHRDYVCEADSMLLAEYRRRRYA